MSGKSAKGGTCYEDVFVVRDLDVGGQRFHNVSRVIGTCESSGVEVVLDIQCELYRLKTKEKFTLALATTLDLQGKPDDAGSWSQSNELSLLDKYDYAMHGKIFRREAVESDRVAVYVSHGGLLMKLKGNSRFFAALELDTQIYTLLKKSE
jgi:DNA-directed RNA polymerase I, II, and III subunit RPABC3